MDYTNIVTSTFGNAISLLVDGNNNTFPVYTLGAVSGFVPYPGFRSRIQNFGKRLCFAGRMNFMDRGAGITVFGSNDGETWTRITPEENGVYR